MPLHCRSADSKLPCPPLSFLDPFWVVILGDLPPHPAVMPVANTLLASLLTYPNAFVRAGVHTRIQGHPFISPTTQLRGPCPLALAN